jgi:hypothetical protein
MENMTRIEMSNREIIVNVTSIFGARTRKPIVELSIIDSEDPGETKIVLTPAKAQEIGMKLIHGAESANMDAFFFQFLSNVVETSEQNAGFIMADYRKFREEQSFEMKYLVDEQGEPKPEV